MSQGREISRLFFLRIPAFNTIILTFAGSMAIHLIVLMGFRIFRGGQFQYPYPSGVFTEHIHHHQSTDQVDEKMDDHHQP